MWIGTYGGIERYDGYEHRYYISNMNRPGGGYASGDGVGARAFKLLGDDVSPVNRHEQGSTLEGNIKLPLRLMSFALQSLS